MPTICMFSYKIYAGKVTRNKNILNKNTCFIICCFLQYLFLSDKDRKTHTNKFEIRDPIHIIKTNDNHVTGDSGVLSKNLELIP